MESQTRIISMTTPISAQAPKDYRQSLHERNLLHPEARPRASMVNFTRAELANPDKLFPKKWLRNLSISSEENNYSIDETIVARIPHNIVDGD